MEFDREGLSCVGAADSVAGQRRGGGLSWGRGMSQRGQRNVTGGLAPGRSVLTVQLGGQTMQGARPHVLGGGRGVWCA